MFRMEKRLKDRRRGQRSTLEGNRESWAAWAVGNNLYSWAASGTIVAEGRIMSQKSKMLLVIN